MPSYFSFTTGWGKTVNIFCYLLSIHLAVYPSSSSNFYGENYVGPKKLLPLSALGRNPWINLSPQHMSFPWSQWLVAAWTWNLCWKFLSIVGRWYCLFHIKWQNIYSAGHWNPSWHHEGDQPQDEADTLEVQVEWWREGRSLEYGKSTGIKIHMKLILPLKVLLIWINKTLLLFPSVLIWCLVTYNWKQLNEEGCLWWSPLKTQPETRTWV